jgi:hypothetical protein
MGLLDQTKRTRSRQQVQGTMGRQRVLATRRHRLYRDLQTLLTIAADEDLELRQIDFKTAFLTANLVETVYMDQPTGYEQPDSEERNSSLTSSRSSTDYDNHPSRSTTDQATSSIRSSSEPSRPIAAFTSDARTADADSFSSTSTMSLQRARREMSTR